MDISYNQAEQFLKNLDPGARSWTFQTFDDARVKNPSLTRVLHGDLEHHFPMLTQLNNQGAGVYVTVQQTDGTGRKTENIKAIRSVFFENDIGLTPRDLPLEPSITVETSPGKSHFYYLLEEQEPLTAKSGDDFKQIMEYLIALGSDKNAKDLARVLRLPGFFNRKYDSTPLVRLKPGRVKAYPWSDIRSVFRSSEPDLTDEELDFFIGPSAKNDKPFQVALVASALYKVDPDCDYEQWIKIGMAIHHASGGGDSGHDLFRRWSERGGNYSESDWPGKWQSFRQESTKPVTVKSLYYVAKNEYGWNGAYNPQLKGMRNYVAIERNQAFDHLNRYYALMKSPTNLILVRKITDDLDRWTYGIIKLGQAETYFQNQLIPTWSKPDKDGTYKIFLKNLYDQWKKEEERKEFEGFIFFPHKDIIIDHTDPKAMPNTPKLNTYFGLHNPGAPGQWDNIRRHIMDVWCRRSQPAFDYVLNWLARMFQYPGLPGRTCITIRSDRQGAGKNIIIDELVNAFGSYGNIFSTAKQITGNFNSLMAESIFVVLEEAVWAGSSAAAKSFLKSAITSDRITCEKKFEDARTIKNCAHILCMSNAEWVVPIEPGDRRYYILDCDNRYCGNHGYFDKLVGQIKGGEADALIHHLRTRDIKNFNVAKFPTEQGGARAAAMEFNLDSVEAFVLEALEQADFGFSLGDLSERGEISPYDRNNIGKTLIYDSYTNFYSEDRNNNFKRFYNKTAFGIKVKKIFPDPNIWKVSSVRPEGGGSPVGSYITSTLYGLRRAFDNYLGAERAWETDPEIDDIDLDIFN